MKRPGLTIVQRLWLPIVESLRAQATRLAGMASALRSGNEPRPAPPPASPPPPQRPAEAAQAAINQARASSKPAATGARGAADDWESF